MSKYHVAFQIARQSSFTTSDFNICQKMINRNSTCAKEARNHPCNACCMILGVLLLLKALICAILYTKIQLLVERLEYAELALTPNSILHGLWVDPPVEPQLHMYVYNFTNAYEYIAGNHSKPKLQVIHQSI